MEQLKVGDVVILKSGSPKMTIYEVGQTQVSCVWFVNEQTVYGKFTKETLAKQG